jgi:hypothetical protein
MIHDAFARYCIEKEDEAFWLGRMGQIIKANESALAASLGIDVGWYNLKGSSSAVRVFMERIVTRFIEEAQVKAAQQP